MKNKAFTLIELLIAILIIGILAAIAVQQYQKAMDRTRFLQAVTRMESIWRAQQRYHLANGVWSTNFNELDIDVAIPPIQNSSNTITFPSGESCWIYEYYGGCSMRFHGSNTATYRIYWNTGGKACVVYPANNERGRALCKAVTGHEGKQESVYYTYYF